MSHAEYLDLEARSEVKHEFLRGEVWAMAGGTREHARLAAALTVAIGSRLHGGPCVVYSADVRVRIEATDRSTYPDLTVVCGPVQSAADDPESITNPTLLVEVLSDSSEASDRGEKFAHYRHLPSLREYMLLSQRERRIEVFRRGLDGRWTLQEWIGGQVAALESIPVEIPIDEVYGTSDA